MEAADAVCMTGCGVCAAAAGLPTTSQNYFPDPAIPALEGQNLLEFKVGSDISVMQHILNWPYAFP